MNPEGPAQPQPPLSTWATLLRSVLAAAIERANGRATTAARLLMISPRMLNVLAARFGLPVKPAGFRTLSREELHSALAQTGGNVSHAAKRLKTSRRQVQRLMIHYGLRPSQPRDPTRARPAATGADIEQRVPEALE